MKEDTKAISETRSITSKSKIALPFSGKSNSSFDCKSAFTFQLVVTYVDWISQADSTTEIFASCNSNYIGRSYHEAAVKLTTRGQSNWILIGLLVGINEWIRHVSNIDLIDQASLINSVDLIGLFEIIKIIVCRISCVGSLVEHDGKINPNGPASKLIVICNWTKISLIFRTIFC